MSVFFARALRIIAYQPPVLEHFNILHRVDTLGAVNAEAVDNQRGSLDTNRSIELIYYLLLGIFVVLLDRLHRIPLLQQLLLFQPLIKASGARATMIEEAVVLRVEVSRGMKKSCTSRLWHRSLDGLGHSGALRCRPVHLVHEWLQDVRIAWCRLVVREV